MSGYTLFRAFKYLLFGLFTFNLFYYLGEDLDAYRYLSSDASLGQILETFAVTIDFVAWMVLLALFELETDFFSKEQLQGKLKWAFNATVLVCYPVLVYAFYGYVVALVDFRGYEPIASETVCELVDQDFAYVSMEARFLPLDRENCVALSGGEVFKHRTDKVISAAPPLAASVNLAWIDVANAGAWLLVVLLFEVEVFYQARGSLTRLWLAVIKTSKAVLYVTLLGDAILWTIYGAFIDSWDAYLWLLAFILVDLNVLNFDKDPRSGDPAPVAIAEGGS
jgi:hypothetical protein